jgi:hypothetical protein
MAKHRSRVGRIPKIAPNLRASGKLSKETLRRLLSVEQVWRKKKELPRGVNLNHIKWYCALCDKLTKHSDGCANKNGRTMLKATSPITAGAQTVRTAISGAAEIDNTLELAEAAKIQAELDAAEAVSGGDINCQREDGDVPDGLDNGDDSGFASDDDDADGDDIG